MKNKKGALDLSINAIVVLILAITMLGLGLGFMNRLFGSTTGQLEDITKGIQDQMIEQIKQSNERFAFKENDIEMKRSGETSIYFGIKNDLDSSSETTSDFGIEFTCESAIDESADPSQISFQNIRTKSIKGNDIYIGKVIVKAESTAKVTTYSCKGTVTANSDSYAEKEFYITLK